MALIMPPHHTFHHLTHPCNNSDKKPPDEFSHLTHSTLYRFIMGHAFAGGYTQHIFPQHTPEQIAFQCGEALQTVEHVLFHCPLFTAACQRHPHSQWPPSKASHSYSKTRSASKCGFGSSRRQGPAIHRGQSGIRGEAQGLLFLQRSSPRCHLHTATTY
jgi:hypothetical protein